MNFLADVKLIDVNKNKAVLIHSDGTIEFEGKKAAKVTTNGQLVAETGEVVLELQADGSIKNVKNGQPTELRLDAEGNLSFRDKVVSLDAGGLLVGGNPNAPQMKVEGATTVELKRTAMFVMAAFVMTGTVEDTKAVAQ